MGLGPTTAGIGVIPNGSSALSKPVPQRGAPTGAPLAPIRPSCLRPLKSALGGVWAPPAPLTRCPYRHSQALPRQGEAALLRCLCSGLRDLPVPRGKGATFRRRSGTAGGTISAHRLRQQGGSSNSTATEADMLPLPLRELRWTQQRTLERTRDRIRNVSLSTTRACCQRCCGLNAGTGGRLLLEESASGCLADAAEAAGSYRGQGVPMRGGAAGCCLSPQHACSSSAAPRWRGSVVLGAAADYYTST